MSQKRQRHCVVIRSLYSEKHSLPSENHAIHLRMKSVANKFREVRKHVIFIVIVKSREI
jgi:hypothetical protein